MTPVKKTLLVNVPAWQLCRNNIFIRMGWSFKVKFLLCQENWDSLGSRRILSIFKGSKEQPRVILGNLPEQFICATATNISSSKKKWQGRVVGMVGKIGLQTMPWFSSGQDSASGCEAVTGNNWGETKARHQSPKPSWLQKWVLPN